MARLPQVGEVIGGYRLVREVARGGMGVVFEAADGQLNRKVAIKVIAPVFAEDDDYRQRFIREASSLATADSPHIVQIYGYGDHDGCLYIAMQFIGGGDVRHAISGATLSMSDSIKIVMDVAAGLADAHDVGVLHRDVKPRNVLLRPNARRPHAYLCDFGVSKSNGTSTTITGAVTGTLSYLAPELFDGKPSSPATDLYALGCLLWECLTGTPPYTGEVAQVIAGAVQGPIPQLPETDASDQLVNVLLQRLLAKDPGARLDDAHEASRAASDILRNLPEESATLGFTGDIHAEATLVRAPTGPTLPGRTSPGAAEAVTLARLSQPTMAPAGEITRTARRSNRRGLVVSAAVLAICLVGAGGAWAALSSGDQQQTDTTGSRPPSPTGSTREGNSIEDDIEAADPGPMAGSQPQVDRAVDGDITGDGRGDLAIVGKDDSAVQVIPLQTQGGTVEAGTPRALQATESLQGDYDGDGDLDVASLTTRGEIWVSTRWDDTRRQLAEPQLWRADLPTLNATVSSGDFNGDGFGDVALTSAFNGKLRIMVAASDGGHFAEPAAWAPPGLSYEGTPRFIAGDYTGDGMQDLVEIDDLGGRSDLKLLRSTGQGFGPAERWYAQAGWTQDNMRPVTGDFDGDSRSDLAVVVEAADTEIHLLASSGSGFDDLGTSALGSGYAYTVPVASDIDGDGTTDLVAVTPGPSYRVLTAADGAFTSSAVVDVRGAATGFAVMGRGTYLRFD